MSTSACCSSCAYTCSPSPTPHVTLIQKHQIASLMVLRWQDEWQGLVLYAPRVGGRLSVMTM